MIGLTPELFGFSPNQTQGSVINETKYSQYTLGLVGRGYTEWSATSLGLKFKPKNTSFRSYLIYFPTLLPQFSLEVWSN